MKKRYDEVKHLARAFKENEAKLVAALTETKQQLAVSQAKFKALRQQAQQKLTHASEQIDLIKSVSEREIAVLKAKLLKTEANLMSMEHSLRQKDVENNKISSLCDELISRLEAQNNDGTGGGVTPATAAARRQMASKAASETQKRDNDDEKETW